MRDSNPDKIGRYPVERKLGTGGMAEVWLCRDTDLDRFVAVKVLAAQFAGASEQRERFFREAKACAALSHPGVVPIYEVGKTVSETDLRPFFAMAHMPGGDLKQRVIGTLSDEEVAKIGARLAEALTYVHQKGFVHRDIKPANVLFDDAGNAVLTDLGIVKALDADQELTVGSSVLGTPTYMSPEQCKGDAVDGRSDIYSLGGVIHYMLTGHPPYPAKDTLALITAHTSASIPRLPEAKKHWQSIIDQCLAKDPDNRFADGTALVEAIRTLSSSSGLADAKKTRGPTNARIKATPLILGIAVIAIVGFGINLLHRESDRDKSQQETVQEQRDEKPRVLVIPRLETIGGDSAYILSGFAEALAYELAKLPELAIIPPTSTQSIGADAAPAALASRFNASSVLEVVHQSQSDNAALQVRLLDPATNTANWSTTVSIALEGDNALSPRDVWDVARRVQTYFGGTALLTEEMVGAVNPMAYENFLRGLEAHALRMTSNEARPRAIRFLKRATQLDPDFAAAWAVLAEAMVSNFGGVTTMTPQQVIEETELTIETALALEPRSARANAAAASWYSGIRLDIERAKRHLDIASQEAPDLVQVYAATTQIEALRGNPEEVLIAAEQTEILDPLNTRFEVYTALYKAAFGYSDEAFATLEACFQDNCMAEGFVYLAAASAAYDNGRAGRPEWGPRLQELAAQVARLSDNEVPGLARLAGPLATLWFENPNDEEAMNTIRALFEDKPLTGMLGTTGPTLANVLNEETFFRTLELAVDEGTLFAGPLTIAPLYGANPYPNWVLEHPRYHALWENPKLKVIEEVFRAKGLLAGLPKNPSL